MFSFILKTKYLFFSESLRRYSGILNHDTNRVIMIICISIIRNNNKKSLPHHFNTPNRRRSVLLLLFIFPLRYDPVTLQHLIWKLYMLKNTTKSCQHILVLLVQVTLQQAAALHALSILNPGGLWQTAEPGSGSASCKLFMPKAAERHSLPARGLTGRDNSGQTPSYSCALCFLHIAAKLLLATVRLFFPSHYQLLQNLIKMDFQGSCHDRWEHFCQMYLNHQVRDL